METAKALHVVGLAAALAALCLGAHAGVLYKSVDANGTIMFSDMPPSGDVRLLERRITPSAGTASEAPAASPDLATQLTDSDAALARANARLDQAERELAQARREATPAFTPARLNLGPARMSPASEERIEFHKRNVSSARRELAALLRELKLASR